MLSHPRTIDLTKVTRAIILCDECNLKSEIYICAGDTITNDSMKCKHCSNTMNTRIVKIGH